MRKLVVCVVLLGLFSGYALDGQAKTIESRIDAVSVYSQGATVTRLAEVNLVQGENSIDFTGLSAAISEQRFQVEVDGVGVELGQVKFDRVQQRDAYDAAVRGLQEKIEAVEARIAALDDSSQTANLKLKFLDGIAQGYAKESWFEGARGTADTSSWRTALSVLDEGSSAARATLRDNAKETRVAKQELSKLQRELQSERGKRRASLNVALTLAANKAQKAIIKLHYYQSNARWSPQYSAFLDSETKQLSLNQKALVEQSTDEDWLAARLTLSTSAPSGELIAPQPRSEFLNLRDPVRDQSLRGLTLQSKARRTDAMEEFEVAAPAPSEPMAEVGNYAVSYSIPGRVDVPNNADEEQAFDLASFDFTTELVTRIVPRQSTNAFLTAQFTYDEKLPLYGNQVSVYVDQIFVGDTWMPTALPQDEITLPMGQDRRVELTVRNQGGKQSEGGFIGRRKEQLTANIFEITNRRASSTMIEVFDLYPTAVDDDIEVSIPKAATSPTETNHQDRPGVILWRKDLNGGDTWRINHQYEVSYPASKTLVTTQN